MPALVLTDLTLEYERSGYVVRPIDSLTLDVEDGELVLLVGASGCGKTTLLSALATLLTPASGTIVLDGLDVTALAGKLRDEYRRRGVGVVFQAFNLLPALSAVDNVAMPALIAREPIAQARGRAEAKLRYRSPAVEARVAGLAGGFRLELDEPVNGVAAGQLAVLYDDELALGGAAAALAAAGVEDRVDVATLAGRVPPGGDVYLLPLRGAIDDDTRTLLGACRNTMASAAHLVAFDEAPEAELAGGSIGDLIDEAYRAKYRSSPYLGPMIGKRARSATVKVTPRA